MEQARQERHNHDARSLLAPVIKLRFGSSQRTEWHLSPAQAGLLFTVGGAERCDWPVRAAGVGEEELTFFYSGQHLFVKSERARGARLNGQHLRTDWVAIRGPVHIDVGTATLDVVTPAAQSERIEGETTGVQRIVQPRKSTPTMSYLEAAAPERTQPLRGARMERNAKTLHNEWAALPERTRATRPHGEPIYDEVLHEEVIDVLIEETTLPSIIVSAEAFADADSLPSIMVEPETRPEVKSPPARDEAAASTADTILVLRPEQRRRRVNVWEIAGSETPEAKTDHVQAALPAKKVHKRSFGLRVTLVVCAFLAAYTVWIALLERL